MIKGYKCDFCSDFSELKHEIEEHEKECNWNPKFKNCFSCVSRNYSWDGSFDCTLRLNYYEYEEVGNCPKWEGDLKEIRKYKLKNLK
jgi:hypothetical protein